MRRDRAVPRRVPLPGRAATISRGRGRACRHRPERVRELRTALGFGRDALPAGWVAQLDAFKTRHRAGLPWDAIVEGARVYGDALRRLAETEVRLVHVEVHERLSADGLTDDQITQQIAGIQESVVPLLDGFIQAVHHEHLLQASIEDVHLHLPASETPAERGSVETTIVFLDVESFTELTQTEGDELAIEVLTRLEGLVRTLALRREGKLVKQIGDGLMLAFRGSADAVAFARDALEATTADAHIPPLHVGIHAGPAIYRAGDYIGTTVNLAARVTAASAAGEILITDSVASRLPDSDQAEAVGVRMLRGAQHPLRLYLPRDPKRRAHRPRLQGRRSRAPDCAAARRRSRVLVLLAGLPAALSGRPSPGTAVSRHRGEPRRTTVRSERFRPDPSGSNSAGRR
jgi:class 3 adenylate cyclase